LKGQSEALDARGNIWGVEVVLVCTCGEVVLDDPICVFVVNSNDEAQLSLNLLLLKRWIGARKIGFEQEFSQAFGVTNSSPMPAMPHRELAGIV